MSESPTLHEEPLRGTVAHVVFENPDSGWAVIRFEPDDGPQVTVIGLLAPVFPGESLEIDGTWEEDPRWGRQYRAEAAQRTAPTNEPGIRRYLASGAVRGIGPELARRLVERFGSETLRILDEEPRRLLAVRGIGPKRLEEIRGAWQASSVEREARVFLQGHGLGPGMASRIIRTWGDDTVDRVRSDPYQLVVEVRGIGFRTADGLALELGIGTAAPARIHAGLLHALRSAADTGDCYVPREQLLESTLRLLGLDDLETVAEVLDAMRLDHDVVIEDDAVFLTWLHGAEQRVARRLALIGSATGGSNVDPERAAARVRQVESKLGLELAETQRAAVEQALAQSLLLITGGPGTGKTTIIDLVARCAEMNGDRVLLAAPTGRAAKRVEQATGRAASTIHRLLEYRYDAGFTRGADHPLEGDLVVVDEASMVDLLLMDALLAAIRPPTRLLLVGDADQLPPVGPGAVLRDLIGAAAVPTVRLREIFRQAAESLIVRNAHRVNGGRMPRGLARSQDERPDPELERDRDFFHVEVRDPERALEIAVRLVTQRIPQRFGLDPRRDVQVLAPMHRGRCGVTELNRALQAAINPVAEPATGESGFRLGDRVIQLRNDYDRDVFNGDIGWVVAAASTDLSVEFDGRVVGYSQRDLNDLALAYAISVHKSQGSEYAAVVTVLLPEHYVMLQRNLLYTALTRARRLAVLVGPGNTIGRAVRNAAPTARCTMLPTRLTTAFAGV